MSPVISATFGSPQTHLLCAQATHYFRVGRHCCYDQQSEIALTAAIFALRRIGMQACRNPVDDDGPQGDREAIQVNVSLRNLRVDDVTTNATVCSLRFASK